MGPLVRLEHWRDVLTDEVARARDAQFAWGEHDCCAWAARVVRAISGQDFYAPFAGTYSDERGAKRVIDAHGGLASIVRHCLGGEIEHPLHAACGDVVLVGDRAVEEKWVALAICLGDRAAVPTKVGLRLLSPKHWLAAWRV